jgi:hypothetical protein
MRLIIRLFWLFLPALCQIYNSPVTTLFATFASTNMFHLMGSTQGTVDHVETPAAFLAANNGRCWDTFGASASWLDIRMGWTPVQLIYIELSPAFNAGVYKGLGTIRLQYSVDGLTWANINAGTYTLPESNVRTNITLSKITWATHIKITPSTIWYSSGIPIEACVSLEVGIKLKCRP